MDVPFGVRGGVPLPGEGAAFDPEAEVLATADGHPRAIAYLSRMPVADPGGRHAAPVLRGPDDRRGAAAAAAGGLTGTAGDTALIAAARQDAAA